MIFLTDADVARLVTPAAALDAVRSAFRDLASGAAAVQRRERTAAGPAKLSTLGAVLPSQGVLGAKAYSTVGGRFCFLVVLFAADDGRRLAVLESDALTRLRTAATSVLSTEALHRGAVDRVAVLGRGTQATGHAEAFADRFGLAAGAVVLVGRDGDARREVGEADVVVTATRAVEPILHGSWLRPGAHVCAVGSSRPEARELDESVYRRASSVAVEWVRQARGEAGGLIDAVEAGVLGWDDVVELGAAVAGGDGGRRPGGDVTVFQSVGIGLEDVAVAAVAWRAATDAGAGAVLG